MGGGPHRGLAACQGAEALRGERPFLFLRKKKRSFTPKKKMGPVYGGLVVEDGGIRLSYDREDPSRPLRPALVEQEKAGGPNQPPPAGSSLRAGVVGWSFCGAQGDLDIVPLSWGVTICRRTLP